MKEIKPKKIDFKYLISKYWYKKLLGNKGIYVTQQKWDHLIILDACRYDMFKKVNTIPGTLKYVISRGSSTLEWAQENFKGRYFDDIIYINANPVIDMTVPTSFHKLVSLWRYGWNEEYNTVMPYTVYEETIKQLRNHKEKRFIIHFIQPHYPFIDDKIRDKIGVFDARFGKFKKIKNGKEIWDELRKGAVRKTDLKNAYLVNLERVLETVKELIEHLPGKIVISSDHGNLFGQYLFPFPLKVYGHPPAIYHKDLIRVPWLEVEHS